MKRSRPRPASPGTDSLLRQILESDDYKAALRDRMLAGKASATELALARDLGMTLDQGDPDDADRRALREMDPAALSVLGDLLRLDPRRLRVIRAGSIVGLGWNTDAVDPESRPTEPTSQPDEATDLMPPRSR